MNNHEGHKKVWDSEKNRVRGENTEHSQYCVGERLDIKKKQVKKTKQETRILGTHSNG